MTRRPQPPLPTTHRSKPRPRARRRGSALWLALALSFAVADTGCKRESGKTRVHRPGRAAVSLPEPLPIPDTPDAGIHLAAPGAFFSDLAQFVPLEPGRVVAGILREQTAANLADTIAPHIDTTAAWDGMRLQTGSAAEEILHLPVAAAGVDQVASALANLETRGDFGARVLPPKAPGAQSRLAYLDPQNASLTIADSLRGLATGPSLTQAAKADLWARLDGNFARGFSGDFPFASVEVAGTQLKDLTVTAYFGPGGPLDTQLSPGALTGLLAAPGLAVGATARWSEHRTWVKQTIGQLKRQVDKAGFAAQMVLGKLVNQASTVLRSWNGKVFVGIGPKGHLAFGFGSDDPDKSKRALLATLNTAIGNLSMLRMFAKNVPQIGLRKQGSAHLLTIIGIKNAVGPQLAPLLDERGRLRIAFASNPQVGAVYGLIGADAGNAIAGFGGALTPNAKAEQHLVAAQIAVDAAALAPLRQQPQQFDPGPLFALAPSQPPIYLIVQQFGDRYELRLREQP